MLVETIWAAIYSCVSMSLIVSVLAGSFYLYGRFIFELLRLPYVESSSIAIAAGMAATAFFGWYAYRLGIPPGSFIAIVFFSAIAILILKSIRHLKYVLQDGKLFLGNLPRTIYVLPIFALAFSVQALIAFKSTEHSVGAFGNNDIFNWSIMADQLLGSTGYYNVFPGGSGAAKSLEVDAFGTFFMLALVSKFTGKSALEATPYFTVFCLTLIGYSIFDVVKKSFCFRDGISFGIALLVSAGAFFFYIAYNNFYGQLLATFCYITTIGVLLHLAEPSNKINFVRGIILSAFSLIGLLIVYQSGFFLFAIFSILFSVTYGIFTNLQRGSFAAVVNSTKLLLVALFCGILSALILLPELAFHTVQRLAYVKDVLAGWPLPLISPVYLFSMPVLNVFPGKAGHPVHYIIAMGVMIFVFVFAYSAAKRQGVEIAARLVAFVMFFCLSLAAYLLAYSVKGGIYQVWKFAAFVVLPVSFVFIAVPVFALYHSKRFGGLFRKVLLLIIVCGCILVVTIIPARQKLNVFSNKIDQFRVSKHILHSYGVENVILRTEPYGETMIAFNVLSNDFKLFPLAQTYLPPADISLIKQLDPKKTRMLVPAKCYSDRAERSVDDGYKIISYGELQPSKLFFNVDSAACAVLMGVHLIKGFSGAEPWGTWTDGNKARVEVNIPPALVGEGLEVSFEVNPFGEQSISVRANGYLSGSWVLKEATTLKIVIPANLAEQGAINFDFYIDHPIRPKDVNPASDDPRLLGIGFVSFSMKGRN